MKQNPILFFRVLDVDVSENCDTEHILKGEIHEIFQESQTMITKTREAADSSEFSEG